MNFPKQKEKRKNWDLKEGWADAKVKLLTTADHPVMTHNNPEGSFWPQRGRPQRHWSASKSGFPGIPSCLNTAQLDHGFCKRSYNHQSGMNQQGKERGRIKWDENLIHIIQSFKFLRSYCSKELHATDNYLKTRRKSRKSRPHQENSRSA